MKQTHTELMLFFLVLWWCPYVIPGIYYGTTIFIVSSATGMTVLTLNIHHKGTRGKGVPTTIKKIAFGFLAKIFCITIQDTNQIYSAVFTPECNGATGSSSYIRYKMASQTEVEMGSTKPGVSDYKTVSDKSSRHLDSKIDGDPRQNNGGIHFVRFQNSDGTNNPSVDNFEAQFTRVLQKVYQTIERNEMRLADQDKRDAIRVEWQQVAQIVDRVLLILFVIATVIITGIVLLQAPKSYGNL